MQTVLISGGTGLVGSRLTEMLLAKNYKVIVLSRTVNKVSSNAMLSYAAWNVEQQTIDATAIHRSERLLCCYFWLADVDVYPHVEHLYFWHTTYRQRQLDVA